MLNYLNSCHISCWTLHWVFVWGVKTSLHLVTLFGEDGESLGSGALLEWIPYLGQALQDFFVCLFPNFCLCHPFLSVDEMWSLLLDTQILHPRLPHHDGLGPLRNCKLKQNLSSLTCFVLGYFMIATENQLTHIVGDKSLSISSPVSCQLIRETLLLKYCPPNPPPHPAPKKLTK